jgi:dienelactone hydrolase
MIERFALTLALLFAPLPARAVEDVTFHSREGTRLDARLFRPAGAGPHPAIVALHGCSGLRNARGIILPIYWAWADALVRAGFVVLLVDSGTPRGIGPACVEGPERRTMHAERPKDAYAALGFLQAQPYVKPDRVGVIGWSQGGGAVLTAIPEKSLGRPTPPPAHDFRAAVALYPALCGARIQARLVPDAPVRSWTTRIPLLVLFGEADNWTPFPPCRDFIADAHARGAPVELHAYADAYHAFDAPKLARRELPAYRTQRGVVPIIETNEAAREDAFARVIGFFGRQLKE